MEPIFEPPRPGDVLYSLADLSKSREMLGYRAAVNFEQGLERIVQMALEGEYYPV